MEIEMAQHVRNQVELALDQIRPALVADGGNVEVVAVDESGAVSLLFQGACVGCPSQRATLRLLLEPLLKQRIPGISEVIPVDPS
jgi:Fe-S cluster biogenesis protein NfuA